MSCTSDTRVLFTVGLKMYCQYLDNWWYPFQIRQFYWKKFCSFISHCIVCLCFDDKLCRWGIRIDVTLVLFSAGTLHLRHQCLTCDNMSTQVQLPGKSDSKMQILVYFVFYYSYQRLRYVNWYRPGVFFQFIA